MKILKLLTVLALFAPVTGFAAYQIIYQDIKVPTQKMIEHQNWVGLGAARTTLLSSAVDGPSSASAATITSFSAQPDAARNIVIQPSGDYSRVNSCAIVVTGKDYLGNAISETFTESAGSGALLTGNSAFASVSSVAFPASCEKSPYTVTWNVGIGSKIGLKRCMDHAGDILHAEAAGVKEGTAPTMAASASTVSGNTAIFNTSPDSTKDFDLYFMQNYLCKP